MWKDSNYAHISTVILFGLAIHLSRASNGDRSYIFGKCLRGCTHTNCTNITEFELTQPSHMKLFQWSCTDECKYQCMWIAVDAYQRDGSRVPQFYGKWPFVRFSGIQEPASAIFSLLNGLSHLAIFVYRKRVPSSVPMYWIWHMMAVIGMFTWFCSTIFHIKDTPLTERLDYFCAFGLVLFNLFTLICRIIGTSHSSILSAVALFLSSVYAYHIHYLAFVHFDYGYNMIVNLVVGALNGAGWIAWSLYHRANKPYCWKCLIVMFGLNLLLALELGDFPPVLWTFDAHAIWHAGTVPLSILWYRFIIDDSLHEFKLSKMPDFKKML